MKLCRCITSSDENGQLPVLEDHRLIKIALNGEPWNCLIERGARRNATISVIKSPTLFVMLTPYADLTWQPTVMPGDIRSSNLLGSLNKALVSKVNVLCLGMKSIKIGYQWRCQTECCVCRGRYGKRPLCLHEECWCKEHLHPSKFTWIQEQVCLYN